MTIAHVLTQHHSEILEYIRQAGFNKAKIYEDLNDNEKSNLKMIVSGSTSENNRPLQFLIAHLKYNLNKILSFDIEIKNVTQTQFDTQTENVLGQYDVVNRRIVTTSPRKYYNYFRDRSHSNYLPEEREQTLNIDEDIMTQRLP